MSKKRLHKKLTAFESNQIGLIFFNSQNPQIMWQGTIFNTMKKMLQKALPLAMVVMALGANAQVKVGSNPTTLADSANFQVEALRGNQFFIHKGTGNVGIGTTNPIWPIEIHSNNSVSLLRSLGKGDGINYAVHSLEASTGQYWNMLHRQNSGTNNTHQFTIEYSPNNSIWYQYFTIDTAGKIGLGTEKPIFDLDMYNKSTASVLRTKGAGDGINYAYYGLAAANTDKTWGLMHRQNYAGNKNQFTMEFYDGTTWHPYFSIDTAGKMGLGTEKPSFDLDMYNKSTVSVLRTKGAGDGINYAYYGLAAANTDKTWGLMHRQNYAGNKNQFTMEFYDGTTWHPYFSIDTAGNVGIGTEKPTETLDINGTARVRTLASGAATDSIVTVDANGLLKKRTAASIASSNNWGLNGNVGTSASNFIGTTDSSSLTLKTKNVSQIKIGVNDTTTFYNPVTLFQPKKGPGAIMLLDGDSVTNATPGVAGIIAMGTRYPFLRVQNTSHKYDYTFHQPSFGGSHQKLYLSSSRNGITILTADTLYNVRMGNKLTVGDAELVPQDKIHVKTGNYAGNQSGGILFTGGSWTDAGVTTGVSSAIRQKSDASGTWRFAIDVFSDGSGNSQERMTFLGNGNVGIGTTAPTSKLQVVGLPIYANNAAALGAGLTAGAFYHNGDGIVRVVF